MQSALLAAQRTCEQMTLETEKKCAKMLREAEEAAGIKARDAALLIGEEQERVDAAKAAAKDYLDSIELSLKQQLQLLDELRTREFPAPKQDARRAFDFDQHPTAPTTEERANAIIEEIGQNLETTLNAEEQLPQNVKRFDRLELSKNYTAETPKA